MKPDVPNPIDASCLRLRALAGTPDTPAARAEALEALGSKWESVVSLAAQALGRWGGRESVGPLRELYLRHAERSGPVGSVVLNQLRWIVEPEDAGWILDLCLDGVGRRPHGTRDVVRTLADVLPGEAFAERLAVDACHPLPDHRLRVVDVLAHSATPVPGACAIIDRFRTDPSLRVRGCVQHIHDCADGASWRVRRYMRMPDGSFTELSDGLRTQYIRHP